VANSKVLATASIFLVVLVFISALWGESIISDVDTDFTPPPAPTDVLSSLTYPIANVIFFFQLVTVSTSIQILSLLTTFLSLIIIIEVIYIVRGN
jgi:hypothetical protein